MDDSIIIKLKSAAKEEKYNILTDFNKQLEGSISYDINKGNFITLWKEVVGLLFEELLPKGLIVVLSSLKILSRKKDFMNENVTEHIIIRILFLGGLKIETSSDKKAGTNVNFDVVRAVQKCLSNMIYNSEIVQKWCCSNTFLPGLFSRLKKFKNADMPSDVIWFDLRLIFLLSGKCGHIRKPIRIEHHGLECLIDILGIVITKAQAGNTASKGTKTECVIKIEYNGICNESLKTLYNLLHSMDQKNLNKHEDTLLRKLASTLRNFLLSSIGNDKETEELHSNTINLLLLIPSAFYEALIPLVSSKDNRLPSDLQYNGKSMEVISKILNFLQSRLGRPEKCNMEHISPVLSLMIEMSVNNSTIRKYIRICILPPLKDVTRRPEEGEEIRNKLCGLMTSPIPQLKQASADLIFILCKESVDRLVKYTGYGNAAGLLASRGLMLGGKGNSSNYSSDSDESDTEEYERVKDQINPVTGRLEPPHPSPFEGMTEEQKEYETMKLVNALDKLNRQNMIQPCVIDKDGRPKPVNHISELRKDSKEDDS